MLVRSGGGAIWFSDRGRRERRGSSGKWDPKARPCFGIVYINIDSEEYARRRVGYRARCTPRDRGGTGD